MFIGNVCNDEEEVLMKPVTPIYNLYTNTRSCFVFLLYYLVACSCSVGGFLSGSNLGCDGFACITLCDFVSG
jgi:hypothetical protein